MIAEHRANNPFRRAFWTGEIDARIPALLRAGVGAVLLSDVLDRLRDLFTFFSDLGVVPRGAYSGGLLRWSIFRWVGAPTPTALLFAIGIPISLALIAGYRTRAATVLAWAYVNSVMNRNPYVCDGGDTVIRLLLFWGMFADLGARFSLDCRLGRRAPQASVPALPLRCLQLQIAIIYLFTFIAKYGPSWRDGSAVLLVLQNPQWSRALGPLLARSPALCLGLTRATQLIEGSFFFLVFSPWRPRLTRALAIALGCALHLGIFCTIRVGVFSLIMPVSYTVFVQPDWLDWLELRLFGRVSGAPPRVPVVAGWRRFLQPFGQVALGVTFVPALLAQLVFSLPSRPLPRPLASYLFLLSLDQNWKMFAPDAPAVELSWVAPGVLSDGSQVDLIATAIPGLGEPHGFVYSRWHKFGNNLVAQPPGVMNGLGRYICRRYNGDHAGEKLERFELALVTRPVAARAQSAALPASDPSGTSPAPPNAAPLTLFRQRCF